MAQGVLLDKFEWKKMCNANGSNTNNYDLKNQTFNENFAMQRLFYERKERVY